MSKNTGAGQARWPSAWIGLLALGAALTGASQAQDSKAAGSPLPRALQDWQDWAWWGHEGERCPAKHDQRESRACLWPAQLRLQADGQGARFQLEVTVHGTAQVLTLPGDMTHWPQSVRSGKQQLPVVARQDRPSVVLPPGQHLLEGEFRWAELPASLPLPVGIASLQLSLKGRSEARSVGEDGQLWLAAKAPDAQVDDALQVRTVRLLRDDVPTELHSQFRLKVAGKAREVRLPLAVLPGWQAFKLKSPLPARLDEDGVLRLQAQPGDWTVAVLSRQLKPLAQLSLPQGGATPEETWLLQAQPALRQVKAEGLSTVDPQQLDMPTEWRQHPAYRVRPGETLQLIERGRGQTGAGAEKVTIKRQLWLDFSGQGFTASDRLTGEYRAARLELQAPSRLLKASNLGQDLPITQREPKGPSGIELRDGFEVGAQSRIEDRPFSMPVHGWALSVESVRGILHLPPGWLLLHAQGPDQVAGSWLADWTLWDVFFLTLSTLVATRLCGRRPGLTLGAGLLLSWQLPTAPWQGAWLLLLASLALLRFWPTRPLVGRAMASPHTLLRALPWLLGGWIALQLLPHAVQQLRLSAYPALALEQPTLHRPAEDILPMKTKSEAPPPPQERVVPPPPFIPPPELYVKAPAPQGSTPVDMSRQDPSLKVQTGPGLPNWQGHTAELGWQGPVAADQTWQLWLLPPWAHALLIRLGGLALLVWALVALLRQVPRQGADASSTSPPTATPPTPTPAEGNGAGIPVAAIVLCALLLPLGLASSPVQAKTAGAEFAPARVPVSAGLPDEALLAQIRERQNPAPTCGTQCASVPRAWLGSQGSQVQLRLELHLQSRAAVPLPGTGTGRLPQRILLDGQSASTRRDEKGQLWLHAPEGVSQVLIEWDAGSEASLDLRLPMPLISLSAELPGWRLAGLDARGRAGSALSLSRIETQARQEASSSTPRDALAPLVRIERRLLLGREWALTTSIRRVHPSRAPLNVRMALLAGEQVNHPGVKVQDGQAEIPLGNEESLTLNSTLAPRASLSFQALDAPHQIETWVVSASPSWHVEHQGLAPIHRVEGGGSAPTWRPWPGERLQLSIQKPAGAPGQTSTLQQLTLSVSPGAQRTEVSAQATLHTSLGGDQVFVLPEGAEPLSLQLNGADLPLVDRGRKLSVPVGPGEHTVSLRWREGAGSGIAGFFRSPVLGLPASGVNADLHIELPLDRIALALGGPAIGPAVLIWGPVLALLMAGLLLRRVTDLPLRPLHAALLALGLAPASLWGVAVVAAWLLLLRQRPIWAAQLSPRAHNALQLLILLATLAALSVLLNALRVGLLGYPDLLITGHESHAHQLRWFADRFATESPSAWVISLPLWAYRAAMLAWALWLSHALLGCIRWGWAHVSEGGLWRSGPRGGSALASDTKGLRADSQQDT